MFTSRTSSESQFTSNQTMWSFIVNKNSSNETKDEIQQFATHGNNTVFIQYPPQLMDFAAACFIAFAVIGVTGNFISIVALSKCKRLRNATTAFIVNLCVADFLFCSFSMPLTALTFLERDWNYGDVLCKLFPLVRYSNGAVSLFSVIAITVNRYILVVHPNLYRDMYKARNIAIMISFIWISALVLLLFPLIEVWGRFGFDPKVGTCSILKLNGKSPKMFLYITAFGLPSLVFVICYARIYWVVRKASKQVRESCHRDMISEDTVTFSSKKIFIRKIHRHSEMTKRNSSWKRDKKELRVLKVMMVIFITFVLCYFPVSFVKIFKKEDDLPFLNVIGYLGVYFSNIVNPIIYVVISKEYRR
ncbi:G-protein coupled receptor moody, partial [Stegodyphus mimosarum]